MFPILPLRLLLLAFFFSGTACITNYCPSKAEGAAKPHQRKVKDTHWGYAAAVGVPVRYCGGSPCQGRITDFQDNGTVAQIASYNVGILDGRFTSFYDNGVMESTGRYDDGYQEGKWRWYNRQSTLVQVEFYAGDTWFPYKTVSFENGDRVVRRR